ncbi:U1 small nuclear ribonucleoprotein 70 kDa-like [Daphnia pulex]|uniref:U1 small nuclear ribonucleoprotein 70 kDa-like n=1 Tax=Daphnia pulex TaxID=6669 RepID=UPI001EDF910A|nr:U1 small nuclear ribonucleoprotein 70 kDa-like [Daphnia pulex]
METMWTESAADLVPLLGSQFYGVKFLPGQTVMEIMSEIKHIVSRLRAIYGIVLLDNQIIAKITMSLPPKMKLIFKPAWESTAAAERTLRNLTTRLAQMEKEVKQCEEEKMAEALLSSKKIDPAQQSTSELARDDKEEEGRSARACWECGGTNHTRANCRDYKRKLKRKRDDEEEDRDKKSRRWEREDDDRSRQDKDNNQWRNRRGRDDRERSGRDYGNNNDERRRPGQKNSKKEDNGRRRGYSYSAATLDSRSGKPTEWFADSGATQHMTGNRDLLVNFVPTGSEC